MGARKYCVQNKTKDSSLSLSATVINATLEPLAILKVLIEGLAANEETGIWLTNMTGIPMVPRISPFDLVYLDKENRVVKGVALLPAAEFPPFKKPSVSALVLPLRTLAATKTGAGDQLIFSEIEDAVEAKEATDEAMSAAVIEFTEEQAELFPSAGEAPSFEPDASALKERNEDIEVDEAPVPAVQVDESAAAKNGHHPATENGHQPNATNGRQPDEENEPQPENENGREPEETLNLPMPVSASTDFDSELLTSTSRPETAPEANGSDSHFEILVRPETEKEEPSTKEKEWTVSRFLRWLYPAAYETDRRKGMRIPIPDLIAYDVSSGRHRAFEVGNISSTGIFLITEDRWQPGTLITFSLQREGPEETGTERRMQFQAGAVRSTEKGVGLAFLHPTGMDLRFWEEPIKDGTRRSAPEYVIREFRKARAAAFLGRISPPALAECRRLLYDELSNVRGDCAVSVVLNAEARLTKEIRGDTMLAHPDLITRIVEGGSWAESGWLQDLWAGLLVTSCTPDGQDDSNLVFINLLTQLALIQTRILASVCAKATTTVSANGVIACEKIFSSSEELTKMAGTHDLLKIHRSVAQLAEFGLFEKSVRSSFVSETEGTTTTPTSLGLRMYARCLGRREI
jgi:hypothetical protein